MLTDEEVSPLDERFPRWNASTGGNGISRAIFGLFYEHGPMTLSELTDRLLDTLSSVSLSHIRRLYLHGVGNHRRQKSSTRVRRSHTSTLDIPAPNTQIEVRTFLIRWLADSRRWGRVTVTKGATDTRVWSLTAKLPKFRIRPDGPLVAYGPEEHRAYLAHERTTMDENIASMDVDVYAVGDEAELLARLEAFARAMREGLADRRDFRKLSRVIGRFRDRPIESQRAVVLAIAEKLAGQ